jgi:16S rRNA (guanine527-N7)-methyltransferase
MFHVKHEWPQNSVLPEVHVSRETSERLNALADLLRAWSATVNLIAKGDLPLLWERHIADSLQVLPLLPAQGHFLDLGSGAGFPGLVLAIASGKPFSLVEADRRKAAFLREAARVTGATVTIHATRLETLQTLPARLITLPQLLQWSARLLAPDGVCLFLKGASADTELTQAMPAWNMRVQRWASRTNPRAVILQLSELSRHAGSQR